MKIDVLADPPEEWAHIAVAGRKRAGVAAVRTRWPKARIVGTLTRPADIAAWVRVLVAHPEIQVLWLDLGPPEHRISAMLENAWVEAGRGLGRSLWKTATGGPLRSAQQFREVVESTILLRADTRNPKDPTTPEDLWAQSQGLIELARKLPRRECP